MKCGHRERQWYSQCVKCLAFGTLRAGTPVAVDADMRSQATVVTSSSRQPIPVVSGELPARSVSVPVTVTVPAPIAVLDPLPLSAARIAQSTAPRVATGMAELDRVLGGGLVDGSFVLTGGDAGQGKSTLLLQAANLLARRRPVLYATGEESADKIALRAERLGIDNDLVRVVASDDLAAILELAERLHVAALVIDSIQKMRPADAELTASANARIPAACAALSAFAHDTKTPVLAIGQITKDGQLAGPKSMEHDVDVILYLEAAGGARRRLVAFKNREGSTDEIGLFHMTERGLVCSEESDSHLSERAAGVPGSAVFPALLGERAQLVEVQALVGSAKGDERPRGSLAASGVDPKRVQVILAVLARHAGIDMGDRDVFVSVTAGMRIADPAADLAIALAIASSYRNIAIDPLIACFGELGLAGEVRTVSYEKTRIDECSRQEFKVMSAVKNVSEAIARAMGQGTEAQS